MTWIVVISFRRSCSLGDRSVLWSSRHSARGRFGLKRWGGYRMRFATSVLRSELSGPLRALSDKEDRPTSTCCIDISCNSYRRTVTSLVIAGGTLAGVIRSIYRALELRENCPFGALAYVQQARICFRSGAGHHRFDEAQGDLMRLSTRLRIQLFIVVSVLIFSGWDGYVENFEALYSRLGYSVVPLAETPGSADGRPMGLVTPGSNAR